jgi:tRNA U34 5-methylaminomethyl-2-thiouridine-forming methyltransferase MnmC
MIKIQNKIELIQSDDGSHTLYRKDLNEHYHSTFGAIQESRHIFIEACFKENIQNRKEINVLEVGFGTGLNP